ncbi:MAG: site-specific integrase, partial [Clostridia bacterium]|nr:site-specific integrase [Clostridia bacterium]
NICRPPAVKIRKPHSDKKEPEILSLSQQKRLETKLFRDTNETKLGILISLYMGLRIGEICALKWEDVNLIDNELLVCATVVRLHDKSTSGKITKMIIDSPKTKTSIRKIPIPPLLIPVIRSIKNVSVSPYVISRKETFVNPRTLEYRYKKLLEAADIPRLNYHALRHTFATRCIEVGMDMKTLSELLGHANVSTTMDIYVHSTMEQKRKQMEKLSNYFLTQNK